MLAAPLLAQPSIDAVVNATGYQTKLAPDTFFVIFGRNMGPAAIVLAAGPNYPAALSGTSITFTPAAGGEAITARMYYTVAAQVSGLLPSSIAPGAYAVRVTYNGQTSAPFEATVVARSFGIATANSSGGGPAQATNANVNGGISLVRFTSGNVSFGGYTWTLSPSHPGDTLVLWGTGGGGDPANDSGGTSGDQTAAGNFLVLIAGRSITPLYAGASSGYPGLWQVNFTLPADIELSCYHALQVSAGGEISNTVTIAVAAPGETACSDPSLSRDALTKLDAGGTIVGGAFSLLRVAGSPSDLGAGGFYRWTATQWTTGAPLRSSLGRCTVYDQTYAIAAGDPANFGSSLDAGARLPLSGPGVLPGGGLGRLDLPTGPSYLLSPAAGTFAEGRYTLTGTGGTEVGSFTVGVNFPASFTVTNFDAITAIDRSQPLTLNWTGAVEFLTITVVNSLGTATSNHVVIVTCYVPGGPGTFTIPASALAGLLAAPATTFLGAQAYNFETFGANLVAGGPIDFGSFGAGIQLGKAVPVR
jgi:uncharacterized protein (TIGR03437 family)